MISKAELSKVIRPDYMDEGTGAFLFHEADPQTYGLKDVLFDNSGHFLTFSSCFLKDSCEIYKKQFKETYLRKDCDKVVLLEKEDKLYLFWIEVKTSLHEVFHKGIFQILGCYYRVKAFLDNFVSHSDEGVIECALAIYAPDAPQNGQGVEVEVKEYTRTKYDKIAPDPESDSQKIEHKYSKLLTPKVKNVLDGKDFGTDQLPLQNKYKVDKLPFIVWPVTYRGGVVNMNEIVALL